jgi:hypothetical protein
MTLKRAAGKTINEMQAVHMQDARFPEGSESRFTSCVPGGSSSASLSNSSLHYEIVYKDCKSWI